MKKSFWITITLAIILVIFSVQNAKEVPIKFFFKDVSISLAILLISVFIFGAISGASYFFFSKRKSGKQKKVVLDDNQDDEQDTNHETTK